MKTINRIVLIALTFLTVIASRAEVLRYHTLVVDGQDKIVPWFTPVSHAFDNYLDQCWAWALAAPLDAHGLPISYLYSSWNPGNPPSAFNGWENDVGEKIPVWVESARLYYQYTGNRAPLDYVKGLVDYSLVHGQTPTNHVWPDFPVGTANAGDTEFRGFTGVWELWDCHVDLGADIGAAMFRMWQLYGDAKYRDKAIHVADVLFTNIVPGTLTTSPWPYVVNSQTGANQSRYCSSWAGALKLFDGLITNNLGHVSNYVSARATLKNWLLTYPMQNGLWVHGHSDVKFDGTNDLSTTVASEICLYLLENPGWDTNYLNDVPKLLKWTEDNFVNPATPDNLPGQYHGAFIPAEQTLYNYRMGYQTARLGAQYALWYEASGDPVYKDRAYRCFAYNTYMMQANGQSSDGPTDTVGFWWSDCYGEATMMYYSGLAAVPEWAPPDENHLLRSSSIVKTAAYTSNNITYTTWDNAATELFRLASIPTNVLAGGVALPHLTTLTNQGWIYDGATGVLRVRHDATNQIQVQLVPPPVGPAGAWSLAFDDEFNGSSLDTNKWNPTGWVDNDFELQNYKPENVEVSGGTLKLWAKQEVYNGKNYTSGKITTQNKFWQKYGYFETRMKLPRTSGLWPAFWLLIHPYVSDADSWPPEVDIQENVLNGGACHEWTAGVHYGANYPAAGGSHAGKDGLSGTLAADLTTDFHTFGYEWSATNNAFYVDGVKVGETSAHPLTVYPMWVLLQMAVQYAPSGILPAALEVDYVRVYQKAATPPATLSITSPSANATFTAPALVNITAAFTGDASAMTNVELFSGTNRLGAVAAAPYSFIWPNVPIGTYALTARVTDNTGLSVTSAPVSITVIAPGGTATLGNTNEGATTDYITDNSGAYINACRFQATANATVTQMRAKVGAITGRYQCAIYSDNGGNASALLANTVTLTNVTGGWQPFPLTSSLALTNGNYYWLAIWSDDVNASISADTGGQEKYAAYPFGNWPNPINLTGSGGFTYCIYATGPAPTAFQQWKSNYDLAANTPNTSDTDGDGIPLLLEYTYGLNPLTNSPAGSPAGALQSNYLTLTYQKIKAATDITCTAEVSSNLTGPWLSGSNDVDQLWQVGDGLTTQNITARDKTPVPNATSRFMRLKVSQP